MQGTLSSNTSLPRDFNFQDPEVSWRGRSFQSRMNMVNQSQDPAALVAPDPVKV